MTKQDEETAIRFLTLGWLFLFFFASGLGGTHAEILQKPGRLDWPAPALPLPAYLPTVLVGNKKKKSYDV